MENHELIAKVADLCLSDEPLSNEEILANVEFWRRRSRCLAMIEHEFTVEVQGDHIINTCALDMQAEPGPYIEQFRHALFKHTKQQAGDAAAIDYLVAAALAVVARWDSPKWKDEQPTAAFVAVLRQAVAPFTPNPAVKTPDISTASPRNNGGTL